MKMMDLVIESFPSHYGNDISLPMTVIYVSLWDLIMKRMRCALIKFIFIYLFI